VIDPGAVENLRDADAEGAREVGQLDDVEATFADLVAADPFLPHTEPSRELLLVQTALVSQLTQGDAEPLVFGTLSVDHRGEPTA
jgi:hypothetical protein